MAERRKFRKVRPRSDRMVEEGKVFELDYLINFRNNLSETWLKIKKLLRKEH